MLGLPLHSHISSLFSRRVFKTGRVTLAVRYFLHTMIIFSRVFVN